MQRHCALSHLRCEKAVIAVRLVWYLLIRARNLAHERLAIVGLNSGAQPLYSPDKKLILAVNGEIYNHKEIRARYEGKYEFQTDSTVKLS